METIKLVTWNVNGLRAILKKNFTEFSKKILPDVICLQETRCDDDNCPIIDSFDFKYFNHSKTKKGYSGTAVFSQIEPLFVKCFDLDADQTEGRVIIVEFKNVYLVNTYVPNSKSDLSRLSYRVNVWDSEIRKLLKKLDERKSVIWCGDLNVAHCPIDLEYPEANHLSAGFTDEERSSFNEHLEFGFVDVFRFLHQNQKRCYSWWSYRMKARERNIGWRIDYFLVSKKILKYVQSCDILTNVLGSDHAPVSLVMNKELFL